jgi:hypothetical protein
LSTPTNQEILDAAAEAAANTLGRNLASANVGGHAFGYHNPLDVAQAMQIFQRMAAQESRAASTRPYCSLAQLESTGT